ncbi:MAG: DUF1684 domain-containing protein [Cytophagales bacterium]|nr:DUF1684 domain-containing protein [Cytophagales bacterium]
MKNSKPLIYALVAGILIAIVFYNMGDNEENYAYHLKNYREKYEKNLLRGEGSPIEDKANFKGLAFFPPNTNLIVQAKVEKFKDFKTLEMITNRQEKTYYIYYATLHFTIQGQKQQLVLFQNQENNTEFFLPFKDLTNGKTSYGSGRYLDVKLSTDGSLELDFNKAYSPYCAYNYNFSCPIPPEENHLKIKIEAGEKIK